MPLIALLATLAAAEDLTLVPSLATPAQAARRAVTVRVAWGGPAADVRVGPPGRTLPVATGVGSPYDVGRLRADEIVEIVRDGEVVGTATGLLAWSPYDVAAWSGPGLRGATVTGLAPGSSALWVATDGGGLAVWDGARFAHLGRRQGFADRVLDVSLAGDARWFVTGSAVVRLDGGGHVTTWSVGDPLPGQARAIAATSPTTALVATDAGVSALGVDASATPLAVDLVDDRGCARLVGAPLPAASCAHVWTDLDAACVLDAAPACRPATLVPSFSAGVRAIVPRGDGAWLAWPDRLVDDVSGTLSTVWRPATGRIVDADRLGHGLLVAADDGGAWHVDGAEAVHLRRASGLPSERALVTAPGPIPGKAWLGTDRGVALVTEADTATPLPLAPLAAGIGVVAVAGDGRRALVATEDGVTWLGEPPRGGDALAAAVSGAAVDVLHAASGWWVIADAHAWRLDPHGRLTRWALDGRAVGLAAFGEAVALATTDGLRWWLDGAKLLGPLDPVPGLRAVAATAGGGLWVLAGDEVRRLDLGRSPQAWTVPGARALAPSGPGVIVATTTGLRWLTTGHEDAVAPEDGPFLDAFVALGAWGGALWTLSDDGTLARDGVPALRVEQPHGLAFDRSGLWVTTGVGLWRVVP